MDPSASSSTRSGRVYGVSQSRLPSHLLLSSLEAFPSLVASSSNCHVAESHQATGSLATAGTNLCVEYMVAIASVNGQCIMEKGPVGHGVERMVFDVGTGQSEPALVAAPVCEPCVCTNAPLDASLSQSQQSKFYVNNAGKLNSNATFGPKDKELDASMLDGEGSSFRKQQLM